ncbi:MAG: thiamine-phosphate kinase [Candidatus Omnitrophota bacterium]
MRLNKVGEFGLIKKFQEKIKTDASVIKGSGDDCAVLKFDQNNYQLLTTDMIVEGVDFKKDALPNLIGRKALAISISDIVACGGIPKQVVVALGLPKTIFLKKVEQIAKGLFDLAKAYKINVVGGDISVANQLVINTTLLGVVEKNKLCLRQGAKVGDLIMVSGEFGGSIKGKHLKFTPRLKESRYLVDNFKVNAMIDVSDGLIQDLGHILEQSQVGAVIYESLVPLSKIAKNIDDALCSGEEFELLFTVSRDMANKIIKSLKYKFNVIGEIMPKSFGLRTINLNNKYSKLKLGYRHF